MRVGGDEDQGFHHLVVPRFHRGAIRGNVLPVTRNDLVDAVRQRGLLGTLSSTQRTVTVARSAASLPCASWLAA